MKIEVTIGKRAVFFLGLLFVVVGAFFVYAVTPNPGHAANTIGSGQSAAPQTYGQSSTFGGVANDIFYFPGKVSTGVNADPSVGSGGPRNLFVHDGGAYSGIGISSTGLQSGQSATYIDFIHDGAIKANLDYSAAGGVFLINGNPSAAATKVGLNKSVPTVTFDVGGTTNAQKFCLGTSDCKSTWGKTQDADVANGGNPNLQIIMDPGSGPDIVTKPIGPYSEDKIVFLSFRFCALVQTEVNPGVTGGGGGCSIEKGGSVWSLKGYRSASGVAIVCTAMCIQN